MMNDLSSSVAEARDAAGRQASDLADQARSWWDRGSDVAHERAAALRAQARMLGHGTREFVRDEPLKSALMAAALGALLAGAAWWIARRRL